MIEVWKKIKEYPGYQVSNFGRIKSFRKYREGRILKENVHKSGYIYYKFYKENTKSSITVHRLVCKYFVTKTDSNCMEVNHIDGNKINNNADNLEWCTRSMNIQHAFDSGLKVAKAGQECGRSKLTEIQVYEIVKLLNTTNMSCAKIGKLYEINGSTVNCILNRKSWKKLDLKITRTKYEQ